MPYMLYINYYKNVVFFLIKRFALAAGNRVRMKHCQQYFMAEVAQIIYNYFLDFMRTFSAFSANSTVKKSK